MTVTLSENNRTGCTNVLIIKDMLVEGQEDFYISIKVHDYSGSYTQEGGNVTMITIVDSNGRNNMCRCTFIEYHVYTILNFVYLNL